MKTIELKWIEDDNHVVAEDAFTGLKELIETGVFPNLKVECKDDTLYITGEQEDLDKAVAKIQKSYVKYGQIAIKENHKKPEGIRIESYDANVQDIFDHTLKEFEEFKESTKHDRPTNYITKLGQFQVKFNKFKEVAAKDDKKIIDGFLTEIETLEENADALSLSRIKPIKKKINESVSNMNVKFVNPFEEEVYNKLLDMYISKETAIKLVKEYSTLINKSNDRGDTAESVAEFLCSLNMGTRYPYSESTKLKKLYNEEIKKQLSNPSNWGIIDENLLSPSEMKKKLQRVAAKWAYETGVKFDDAYNELRKKKSVKDMLDFYSVEEIIDDLKQNKTEEDDEIVESRGEPRKIKSRAELIRKAIKQDATEIESWDEFMTIKENQLMNELGYSMDINGNKTGAIWMGDRDGKMYYCTNQGVLIRT